MQTLAAVIAIITAILALAKNWLELRKVQRKINELSIVVKDTRDIRDALRKPLEGAWKVAGNFHRYRGLPDSHNTKGLAMLTWIPDKYMYEVFYAYTVFKNSTSLPVITAYSMGVLPAGHDGEISDGNEISIILEIEGRTALPEYGAAYQQVFKLEKGTIDRSVTGRVVSVNFVFNNQETNGALTLTQI